LALAQEGKLDEAIEHYREALRIDPIFAGAYNNLGAALLNQGHVEDAIANFRLSLQFDPGHAETHNNLGNALTRLGQLDGAITEYRQAVMINRGYGNAYYNLANALFLNRRSGEAIEQLQKALDLQPGNAIYQNDLALMLTTAPEKSLRNGPKAVDLATQANRSTGGSNPIILRTLAAAYAEAGDFPRAVETAGTTVSLLQKMSNKSAVAEMQRELKLYRAGRRLEDEP
jgi:superkiller protein 3